MIKYERIEYILFDLFFVKDIFVHFYMVTVKIKVKEMIHLLKNAIFLE